MARYTEDTIFRQSARNLRYRAPTAEKGDKRKSDLEGAKIGDAGFHQVQVHFDEVILYAGGFRGGEDFLPIESVLPHGHDFLGLRRPALNVHGKEAAGIFREIFGGVIALADGGDLELELDELGIEKFEQHVVGALAVHGRKLEVFVVKALLEAGLGGKFAHFVVFVGGALDVVQSWLLGAFEAGHDHLREADIFRPGNAGLLIVAKLLDAEVRTDAGDAGIGQNFAELGARVFGEAAEAMLGITYGRAKLNGLKSCGGKLLDGARKILGNHFPNRPGLAADGQAERIGAKLQHTGGKESGCSGAGGGVLEKFSSRQFGHGGLLLIHYKGFAKVPNEFGVLGGLTFAPHRN